MSEKFFNPQEGYNELYSLVVLKNKTSIEKDRIENELAYLTKQEEDTTNHIGNDVVLTQDEITPEEADNISKNNYLKAETLRLQLQKINTSLQEIEEKIQDIITKKNIPETKVIEITTKLVTQKEELN